MQGNLHSYVLDIKLSSDRDFPLFLSISDWSSVSQNKKQSKIEFSVQDSDGYLLRFSQPQNL